MGWRKNMKAGYKNINSKASIQKRQNIQKVEEKFKNKAFVPFVPFVVKNQKTKTYQQQHEDLWEKAWKLADWIDDPDSDVPWQERTARVPELQKMSMMIGELECLMNDTMIPINDKHVLNGL